MDSSGESHQQRHPSINYQQQHFPNGANPTLHQMAPASLPHMHAATLLPPDLNINAAYLPPNPSFRLPY